MWWITLIIAAVLFIAFSAFLKLSYVKSYSGPMGELSLSIAKSYATFSPLFKFSPNFLDIILSLLYKLILFIIAALCVYFFDTILIPSIIVWNLSRDNHFCGNRTSHSRKATLLR